MEYPLVDIHTHSRRGAGIEMVSAMALSGALPDAPFSVGIHPWQVGTPAAGSAGGYSGLAIIPAELLSFHRYGTRKTPATAMLDEALNEVETAPANAIGEIGLDYSRPVPRQFQREVFEAQLEIAQRRGLPVILHCVRAFEPMMEILRKYTLPAVIFHGFTGSLEQIVRATKEDYWLSFGERSLASPKTVDAVRSIPLFNFFLETDESELSIADIYRMADRDMFAYGVDMVGEVVYRNYKKIFGE